jgi:hypothetical protein
MAVEDQPLFIVEVPWDDRRAPLLRSRAWRRYNPYASRWECIVPERLDGIAIWHWTDARKQGMPLNLRATLMAIESGAKQSRIYGDCVVTTSNRSALTLNAANLAIKVLDECQKLASTLMLAARAEAINEGRGDMITDVLSRDDQEIRKASGTITRVLNGKKADV